MKKEDDKMWEIILPLVVGIVIGIPMGWFARGDIGNKKK